MSNCKFILFFCLLITLSACRENKTYRIGISQCSVDDWRSKMNGEIEREIMFHPEASIEILSAHDDSNEQIEHLNYFIDNRFDIILVAPNEAKTLAPVVSRAFNSGIPVLVFDRNIYDNDDEEDYTAFQGADNIDIGRQVARHALAVAQGPLEILEIYGLPGSTPAEERHQGFLETLETSGNNFDLISVVGNWNSEDAYQAAKEALENAPATNIIFAHNDRMAIAASKAATELGMKPYIIGIDAAPEIGMAAVHDGVINATFLYPTEGAALIRTAIAILEEEPFNKKILFMAPPAVTKDNVDVLLRQNAELINETSHLELLQSELNDYWQKHTAQRILLGAVITILLLSFGVIFAILKAVWTHKTHRMALAEQNVRLEQQKAELISLNNQLNEATQSKLMFFTNVSHDLRTPITLIAEPVEQLAKADNLTKEQHTLINLANKNVHILKRLVNQILDFRKYEHGKLDLNLTEVDLSKLLADWISVFSPVARRRHINLTLDLPADKETILAIDAEKIERVFFNLVSNAFKYSPDNATIAVSCHFDASNAVISVSDTGKGIANKDIKNLFDRFFQVENVHPTGSGIGLSLVKAFVEMHGGTISVESELGKGSCFTVILPVRHVADKASDFEKTINTDDVEKELDIPETTIPEIDTAKPVLLVIDDNRDILNLLQQVLADEYNVITAADGRQGLKMATRYVPDVIICDVMMPVMDGLECCRSIKEELSTSHIPVIMLTACSMDEQKVQGFESGADGYIAKPFNTAVLKAQLKNMVENRRRIKNLWAGSTPLPEPAKETVRSEEKLKKSALPIDNEFYMKFINLVNKNMSDPDLSVDWLASELGLARSQFYRKIKALTNFSPVELIRTMRLKEARRLLTTTERSVSEVGFDVGFSSAAYFTKCFHEEYGETPSQLRERLGH